MVTRRRTKGRATTSLRGHLRGGLLVLGASLAMAAPAGAATRVYYSVGTSVAVVTLYWVELVRPETYAMLVAL